MSAYYNELDPFAAQWLRSLIKAGLIAPGDVDDRSIKEVQPDDLKGYTQCHFFAGIGGWSYALRLSGWDDNRPVWTGSCPCQPFSAAGKKSAQSDERHLWPDWARLIRECRPSVIFGEQVERAVAAGWLDDVFHDLEAEAYACAAAVLPACAAGGFHRRDRIWFVANAKSARERREIGDFCEANGRSHRKLLQQLDGAGKGFMGDPKHDGWDGGSLFGGNAETIYNDTQRQNGSSKSSGASKSSNVANAQRVRQQGQGEMGRSSDSATPKHWEANMLIDDSAGLQWIICPDGKSRPVKPGICLLAHGVSNRVGKLRGFGNAIHPPTAAEFIRAYEGVTP